MPVWLVVVLLGCLLAFVGVPYAGVVVVLGVCLFLLALFYGADGSLSQRWTTWRRPR